jgi:hypothetical protein
MNYLGDKELSKKFYSEAAKFPMTYYGQLAFNKLIQVEILN